MKWFKRISAALLVVTCVCSLCLNYELNNELMKRNETIAQTNVELFEANQTLLVCSAKFHVLSKYSEAIMNGLLLCTSGERL